ncbi:hypothetical protein FisN_18Hu239 [Fistulifera solaris]|uniref:Impact N-terminal domain-containing protein n=1 Tax=Fistulifera solaris TaxID=1519565 RepID=A0A1Z5JVE7_FISSO|nr:hypothetical protein FisN_18Hu239 [Fistulifera solaris]|eukprot:GAX18025.1 hypothetical protein FisN_18Hu239 [Fistulifera solaris]
MDSSESFERARADIEMLLAAFDTEIQMNDVELERLQFPFQVTFQFSPTVSCVLEWREGYPLTEPLHLAAFRASTSHDKVRLEAALTAFRQHAQECFELQMEAALTCCSAALQAWNEYIEDGNHITNNENPDDDEMRLSSNEAVTKTEYLMSPSYQWMTGEPLLDRKSTFQAHVCNIQSDADVQPALLQLLQSSTKLQRATHNMYAWRVCQDGVWKHDNDDDGEDAAGSRLAHLLSVRNENGVLVVVSRWFGGIHLGSKRFAHITNVARQILDDYKANHIAA